MGLRIAWDYPLYVLRRGEGFLASHDFSYNGKAGDAIAVFTSADRAEKYAVDVKQDVEPFSLATACGLRDFLFRTNPLIELFVLDPQFNTEGPPTARWLATIERVMRMLPPPGYPWDFPLHIVRTGPDQVAALQGTSEAGDSGMIIPMFTDEDLAMRYMARLGREARIQTYLSPAQFAHALQRLNPSQAVTFDPPPERSHGRLSATTVAEVLKQLAGETG